MANPITYQSATPRHQLPLLFAAQAQKEATINEAASRLDALTHLAIEGERNDPPGSPTEGQCWLVGDAPSGDWLGHADEIACFSGGTWLFLGSAPGMVAWRIDSAQFQKFDGTWSAAAAVTSPSGGSVVDAEARLAIEGIIAAITAAGILAPT